MEALAAADLKSSLRQSRAATHLKIMRPICSGFLAAGILKQRIRNCAESLNGTIPARFHAKFLTGHDKTTIKMRELVNDLDLDGGGTTVLDALIAQADIHVNSDAHLDSLF